MRTKSTGKGREPQSVPFDRVAVILSKGTSWLHESDHDDPAYLIIAKKLTNATRDLPRSRSCSREGFSFREVMIVLLNKAHMFNYLRTWTNQASGAVTGIRQQRSGKKEEA